jgi:hypothetical protein
MMTAFLPKASSPTSPFKEQGMRNSASRKHGNDESVEIVLLKGPGSPTSTSGLVLCDDPGRSPEGSYHLVTMSSSEDTEDPYDELVGLQYLPEDE